MRKAVAFYHGKVSSHGGYVYKYSDDLAKHEGEGKTGPDTVWVQPPGTQPSAWRMSTPMIAPVSLPCSKPPRPPAICLVHGQLRSGGWSDHIDFDPDARAKIAYRVDPPTKKTQFNVSTFDDDKTQSAVRFLVRLDKVLDFKDVLAHSRLRDVCALDPDPQMQFPSGGWGQGWEEFPDPAANPAKKASFPDDWPR